MIIPNAVSFYSKRYFTHHFVNKLLDDTKNVYEGKEFKSDPRSLNSVFLSFLYLIIGMSHFRISIL